MARAHATAALPQETEDTEEEPPEPSEEVAEELPTQVEAGMGEVPSPSLSRPEPEDDEAPTRTAPEGPSDGAGDDLLDL